MKYESMIAILVFLTTSFWCSAQTPSIEATIRKLDGELEAALEKGDSITISRILADDYVEIDAQGVTRKKADLLVQSRQRDAAPPAKSIGPEKTVSDSSIRVHGDTAIVMGLITTKYQFMEYQTSGLPNQPQNPVSVEQERFLRVYAGTGGHWQLIVYQTTHVAKR